MSTRREFIGLVGGAAAAWPVAAWGQRGERSRQIAVVLGITETDPEAQARLVAFDAGLREIGFITGRNVAVEYHWAAGQLGQELPMLAAELARRQVTVIVVLGSTPAALAA